MRKLFLTLCGILLVSASAKSQCNLVTNGSFENGNNSFGTDLNYNPGNFSPDNYTIDVNATAVGLANNPAQDGNLFMIVDGSTTNPTSVWNQTLTLTVGNSYTFCFWHIDLHVNALSPPPSFNVLVNGVVTNATPFSSVGAWVQSCVTFVASVSNNTISINQNFFWPGSNDFGIDNITLEGFNTPLNLGPDQLICNGSSVNLNAGAGFANYQWSQPGTCLFGGPNMNACVTGNYCVTVTDANGCTASDCAYITISNMPNISILCTDPDICSGESVTLSANPACIGCTYSWSPGGATSNSITVSPAVTTNYSVLVTNAQGCFDFASQQVTVDQNCPPTSLCMHIDQIGNTDVGRRVTSTSDGGFVAIGDISGAHNAADRDLYVIKYKPDMTVDFRKRIGDFVSGTTTYIYNESGFDVMPVNDGYLVAGTVTISATNTNIILLKLDLNGNFVWRTTRSSVTNDKIDEARKIVRISPLSGAPTRYYLVGHTNGGTPINDYDIIIYEFAADDGSIIGTPQRFGDTGVNEFATDAIANEDQNAIIVSGFADVSSTNRDMFALKVSPDLVWASSFYNGGAGTDVLNSVAQIGKNLFFAGSTRTWGHSTTSNIYVLKVDESMFTATTNKVYSSNIDEVANTIIKTSDNNLLLVGSYRTMDAVNMKIDDDLNQLWLFKSSLSRIETFNGVTEQNDGLFAAVGMYNEGVSDDEFYISRIKSDGSSCCNTPWSLQEKTGMNPNLKGGQRNGTLSSVKWGLIDNTGIEKYLCQDFTMVRVASNNEESSFDAVERLRGFKVIPNPSNGIFKLMFETELENVTTNIYDLSGRKVKSISNLSASTINLDLSELNDGIYLLEATGEGFSERQKIVIRK